MKLKIRLFEKKQKNTKIEWMTEFICPLNWWILKKYNVALML